MKNLIADLIKFQKEVPLIPKNCVNPFFSQGGKKAMYADLPTVIDVCKPVLNKNNLAVIQTIKANDGKNQLVTMLCHTSGETLESNIYLPDIQDAQKLTAAITYLRRATYLSIVGLVADDDTDGNDVPGTQPQQKTQANAAPNFQNVEKPASEKQKELVKKNYPDMDVSNLSMKKASELIQNAMRK